MNKLRTGAFFLFGLLVPVSCAGPVFTELVICYFLDAFLMVYCITATVFFFREKYSNMPPREPEAIEMSTYPGQDGGVYQQLERLTDADPYQVLEPKKRKKKAAKKKKRESTPAQRDLEPFETLAPRPPPQ